MKLRLRIVVMALSNVLFGPGSYVICLSPQQIFFMYRLNYLKCDT